MLHQICTTTVMGIHGHVAMCVMTAVSTFPVCVMASTLNLYGGAHLHLTTLCKDTIRAEISGATLQCHTFTDLTVPQAFHGRGHQLKASRNGILIQVPSHTCMAWLTKVGWRLGGTKTSLSIWWWRCQCALKATGLGICHGRCNRASKAKQLHVCVS